MGRGQTLFEVVWQGLYRFDEFGVIVTELDAVFGRFDQGDGGKRTLRTGKSAPNVRMVKKTFADRPVR